MTPSAIAALPVEAIVDLVRARTGVTGELQGVERRPNGFSTKAATDLVTLHFEGGRAVELFVKNAVASSGRRPDPPDAELRVYRALGGHPAFAAPDLVGTAGDHLVLAAISGWDLRYHDLDAWETAAATLGRMHARFAAERPALSFLVHRGEAAYLDAAARALDAAGRVDPAAGAVLTPVVDGYSAVARALTALPATLVHGDLAPKNVLVARDEAVFVDWEWAHAGPGATDLADLVNGLDAAATERLVTAYVREARGSALPGDDAAIAHALDLARLERVLFRIERSSAWGVDAGAVRAWADDAARLFAGL